MYVDIVISNIFYSNKHFFFFFFFSVVWCTAADSYLKLLARIVKSAGFLSGGV